MTVYNKGMNERWTIEQLAPLVERALDLSGYNGQHSGRVRSLPDLRTIRFYTTLGLLDPPAEMRGRKAFYGRRHLVQLVAVKRLQARGLSLAQVQETLAGIDDRALAELAALPADFWDRAAAVSEQDVESPATPASQRNSFWASEPHIVTPHKESSGSESVGGSEDLAVPSLALHLPVIDGVQLVLEGIDPACWTPEAIARLKGPLEALAQTLRDLPIRTHHAPR
jgi:DNA-binding transcriptional MerR regulator